MHAGDLGIQHCCLSTEAHGTDAHLVRFPGDALLQLCDLLIIIACAHLAEENFLGLQIRRTAIASDRHAQHTWRAALALRLMDSVQDYFANARQITTGAQAIIW